MPITDSCASPLLLLQVDSGYLSEPRAIEFPTEGGLTAYMNFYPPQNKASLLQCCCLVSVVLVHPRPCCHGRCSHSWSAGSPCTACCLQDVAAPAGALSLVLLKIYC